MYLLKIVENQSFKIRSLSGVIGIQSKWSIPVYSTLL